MLFLHSLDPFLDGQTVAGVSIGGFDRSVHRPQHCGSACLEESDHEDGRQEKEQNVEDRRVIERDVSLHDLGVPRRRNEPERIEHNIDHEPGDGHRRVEGHEQEQADLPAVVLPVDVEDGEHDQVGEDERDHSTEADPPVPEDGRQRHVPDGTDEGQEGHQRTDERAPELRQEWVVDEEESLPEAVRHPGGERAGDEEPAGDVGKHRRPVHDEVVTARGEPAG